jgi:hypothetical protein
MKPALEASMRAQLDRLKPLVAAARARRFWIKCAVVSVIALAATGTIGRSALARSAVVRDEADRLEQVRAGLEQWRLEGILPSPAEVDLWHSSEASLAALSPAAAEPLLVARRVADRADRAGVSDLAIRMSTSDSLAAGPPLQVGSWTIETADTGLIVEFESSIGQIVSFLGALPPQVEVAGLQVSGRGERLRSRVDLRLLRALEQP